MNQHAHPFPGNVLMNVENMNDYDDETRTPVDNPVDANVVSSHVNSVDGRYHRPVLDIDFPAALVPSTTPGHNHLYLDVMLTWPEYKKLLQVLGEVGILEPGYVSVSIERRHTAVRVPWIRKGTDKLKGYAATMRSALVNASLAALRR